MFLIIYLGFGSRQNSIDLPTNYKRATFDAFWASVGLFGLSTPEVCRAFAVASKAVVSYTPFSPLPPLGWRFVFCGTVCQPCGCLPVRKQVALCCPDFPLCLRQSDKTTYSRQSYKKKNSLFLNFCW